VGKLLTLNARGFPSTSGTLGAVRTRDQYFAYRAAQSRAKGCSEGGHHWPLSGLGLKRGCSRRERYFWWASTCMNNTIRSASICLVYIEKKRAPTYTLPPTSPSLIHGMIEDTNTVHLRPIDCLGSCSSNPLHCHYQQEMFRRRSNIDAACGPHLKFPLILAA
jgi:hypothetical protein